MRWRLLWISIRKCRKKRFLVLSLMAVFLLVCGLVIKVKERKPNSIPIRREGKLELPILIIACNAAFVNRVLRSLTHFRTNADIFPIIVYNDLGSNVINNVVRQQSLADPTITIFQNPNPNINRQLKFPLDHVFGTLLHKAVIVLDDNLDISPDFFEYFLATYRLLEKDPSIWCVSAWNDNCKREVIDVTKPHLLHRTDFFPGKGWMIRHETWKEIESYSLMFDAEALQDSIMTRDRVCIRPEISRTYSFGVCNESTQKENSHLQHKEQREFNVVFVPFTHYDLSYLLKEYEASFFSYVYSCPEATVAEIMSGTLNSSLKCVHVTYSNATMFKTIAQTFGLMHDFRGGVTRTALHGIVQCFFRGRRVFLAPANTSPRSITSERS